MKAHILFKYYIWLVNTINRAQQISLAEINEKWLQTDISDGMPINRNTFNRHLNNIQDIFGIIIECNRSNYKYSILNSHVLKDNTTQNWMLSTLSINFVLSESLSLKDSILLEQVPSGGEYLQLIMNAIKKRVRIRITYQRYVSAEPKQHVFEPYCLKMFNRRWYVLAHFSKFYAIFSLDRIQDMELTDEKFIKDKDFNANDYFAECFGIVRDEDVPCEKIIVRAFQNQPKYMRDLPWHTSQREIGQGPDHTDFELTLRPTEDFINHLLGRGSLIRVLSPQWLIEKLCEMHRKALAQYN